MIDAIAFTIALPDGKYASVNRTTRSWRDPRKSQIYKSVYDAVLNAARSEVARTGWVTAECECFTSIMRVMPAQWRVDAMNMGKPELDAMTEAGVWKDDSLANPCFPWVRYDDGGPHRVTIMVMKLYRSVTDRKVERTVVSRRKVSDRKPSRYQGGTIPHGYALVNGRLVTRESAMKMIQ